MHLEGSLEPGLLLELAARNNIKLPSPEEDAAYTSEATLLERYKNFSCLDDFLHYYFIGMSALIKEEDFEALAWAYYQRAKADGVAHAEVFFDPQVHMERGVAYDTVVSGFTKAGKRAETELGLTNELIVCFLRHMPVKSAEELYQVALPDLKSKKVLGIGLSSSELGNRPEQFKDIYLDAEKYGIRRTAHGGEEGDVTYMSAAVDECHVERIDHGIKLVQDPALMKEYAERKIMLTMCPLSNVRLRCVKSVAETPVRTYLDAGVSFSINSDDPAYFGGYILDNYCAVQDAFNLTHQEWKTVVTNSIEGSWCSAARKEEMKASLEKVMKEFA